jgi:hypothetical protein
MDVEKIGPQLEQYSHMPFHIREKLAEKYFWKVDDARITAFNKLNSVLTTINLGYFLMHIYLSKKDWWKQYQKLDVTESSIQNTLNEFEMFYRIGLIQNIVYSIESSFRIFVRALDSAACKGGQAEFKSIYDWLLKKLNLQATNTELLDLIRNIRNTMHNNGLFFPTNGQNQSVTYKGTTYNFVVGQPNNFVTTELMISLVPDLLDLVEAVVQAKPLVDIGHIQEIS